MLGSQFPPSSIWIRGQEKGGILFFDVGNALFPKILLRVLDLKLTASVNFDLLAVLGVEKDFYYLKKQTNQPCPGQ